MKPLPSDYKILKEIYKIYYDDFSNHDHSDESRIMFPVDLALIAKNLKADKNVVFGRLYYYLSEKYSYKTGDSTWVKFFELNAGGLGHCVNFPLLASVLASLHDEREKYLLATTLSVVAIAISIITAVVSIA